MASTKINSIDLGPIWLQSGNGIPDHLAYVGTQYTDLNSALIYSNIDGVNTWSALATTSVIPYDKYISGMTFSNANYDLTLFRNDGITFTQNLGILASDMTITGGTYDSDTGIATFTNNTGGTFTVSGFLTGVPDTFVTGGTYNPDSGTATFTNTSGGTFNVTGFTNQTGASLLGTWQYNPMTIPPTHAQITTNNSSPSAATQISFYNIDRKGQYFDGAFKLIKKGSKILCQSTTSSDSWITYDVIGDSVDMGDYFNFPVNPIMFGSTASSGWVDVSAIFLSSYVTPTLDTKYDKTGGTITGIVTANAFVKSGGTASEFLKANGSIDTTNYASVTYVDSKVQDVIVDGVTGFAPSQNIVYDKLLLKQNLPTGFISGLNLTIKPTDNTKAIIGNGVYAITDFTVLSAVTVQLIEVTTPIEFTPQFLLTNPASYIALDINKNVIQSSSPFTNADRRTLALIGATIHTNNININVVNEIKAPIVAPTNQLHDLIKAVGSLNLSGNTYSPNGANLQLNKSEGVIWGLGINASNFYNPHELVISAQTAFSFNYRLRTGTQYANTTNIDPDNYDNGGVLTAVPNNRYTIQRINLFQSGLSRIQYGQNIYQTLEDARVNLSTETFVTEQNISDNAIFRAYLIIKKGVTNLTSAISTGDAYFVSVDKFGNVVGGGSVATLQSVYNNSVTPEIVTNSTLGGLSIRNGSGIPNSNLFEGINSASTVTSLINSGGVFSGTSFVKSGGTSSQFLKADGSIDSTTYQPLTSNIVTGTGVNGRVSFWNGTNSQSSDSDFIWDNTNKRLGIGGTPNYALDVYGKITGAVLDNVIRVNSSANYVGITVNATKAGGTGQADFMMQKNGVNTFQFGCDYASSGVKDFFVYDATNLNTPFYVTNNGELRLGSSGTNGTGGYFNTQKLTVKTNGATLVNTVIDNGVDKMQVNGGIIGTSLKINGGTALQFLKADGSTDSTTYQPLLTNPIIGLGTANYISKFTGSGTLGNSMIFDNGTQIGIGGGNPTFGKLELGNTTFGTQTFAFFTADGTVNSRALIEHITTSNSQRVNFTSAFSTASDYAKWTFETGDVGIGTTTPLSKLNVTNLYYSGTPTKANSAVFLDNQGTGVYLGGNEYGYGYIQSEQSDITLTKNLVLQPNGSNVGVGALNPVKLFEIGGEGRANTSFSVGRDNIVGDKFIFIKSTTDGSTPYINSYLAGTGVTNLAINPDGGNVGIGTKNPNSKLQIKTATNQNISFLSDGTKPIIASVDDNSNFYVGMGIDGDSIDFKIRNVSKAFIDADGKFGIGASNPLAKLNIQSDISFSYPVVGLMSGSFFLGGDDNNYGLIGGTHSSDGNVWLQCQRVDGVNTSYNILLQPTGGNVGIGTTGPTERLHVNGNILATGTITPSDIRLKSNIIPLKNSLEKVMTMNPVSYEKAWEIGGEIKNSEFGFIAQELKEIFPNEEIVKSTKSEKEMLNVNYISLIAVLTKAIQEQQLQINELKEKLK